MNRSAQFLLTILSIREFITRSMPIPKIFILAIYYKPLPKFQQMVFKEMNRLHIQKATSQESQLIINMQGETTVRKIKAILCQIGPIYKQKEKTIQRVRKSLDLYSKKDELDIIVFPEMSFTGYNFKDLSDALPLAVVQNEGIQFEFAREIATKKSAYVAFGYIEKVETANATTLYNSAAVIDRQGNLICNYRKCHLYYNDKLWATPGKKFVTFQLLNTQNKKINCSLGICMDINPKEFISGEFELANHCLKSNSQVLIFLTNWVDSEKDVISSNDVAATYNYWIHRMQPVLLSKKTFLLLAADRVGSEFDFFAKKQISFYGSSCAMMFNPSKILKNLSVESEGYLVIDTHLP